jgi:hypothetical protein
MVVFKKHRAQKNGLIDFCVETKSEMGLHDI